MAEIAPEKKAIEVQLERLAHLLLLETRLRETESEVELGYLVANDTLGLVVASTALVWRTEDTSRFASGSVFAVSASALPDKQSPFTVWTSKFCKAAHSAYGDTPCIVRMQDLPEKIIRTRSRHVAANAIWLPLRQKKLNLGAMVLWRDKPWSEAELRILTQWAGTVTHAWHALRWTKTTNVSRAITKFRSRVVLAVAVALIGISLIPVNLSVLAPAELKSSSFTVVRAPLQGVIDELHIESNAYVSEGQLLISLDDAALRTELEVAQQELAIAIAEYDQAQNSARVNPEARARLLVLEKTVEKFDTEASYLTELLSRTQITAPREAIAIVENSDELIGRPVQLGERLMTLVDESELELELWLPVGDDVELLVGSEVNFFPNVAPEKVYLGYLRNMDYQAQMSPLGTLSYKVKASVAVPEGDFSRIGMRGTGKVYGNRVSLFYYVFRRPLAYLRQTFGL